ncbi:D-beta-hydroxybutyrate dehydrogenase, mitochondrial [Periplaneta americana]|uniref:D-beta-hydroxybutyrate dehydrogenase, mitochondrial n=1 Tax=Periplaneta americana TaxID=6978 RepID=UPI0037E94D0D
MDDQTALILALQLIALCCIAAALLLYLLCRIRNRYIAGSGQDQDDPEVTLNLGLGRAVLVTSCDTAFGLQCALHLSNLGFRVFAGLKDPDANGRDDATEGGSLAARILRAKIKEREMLNSECASEASAPPSGAAVGALITIPLDVTREDMLHEAVVLIRRNLPAGEDGLWAVLNTAGMCCKGRLENQENAHWDVMLKYNVVGALRTARTFMPLLKNKKGRLINMGANINHTNNPGSGLVAYTAARYAVEGASTALRHEMAPHGIHVITLQPNGVALEKIFAAPRLDTSDKPSDHTALEIQHPANKYLDYNPSVLPSQAMRMIEEALLSKSPKQNYQLLPQSKLNSLNHSMLIMKNKIMSAQIKPTQLA